MKRIWLLVAGMLVLACGARTVSAEDVPMSPFMLSIMTPVQGPSPEWNVKGLRVDILYGRCHDFYGLDLGLVNHATGNETAFAAGLINCTEKEFIGLQIGAVNIGSRVQALQIGLFNEADDASALQIGLINHARMMQGMQIGLVNVIEENDLPFLPVINFFF